MPDNTINSEVEKILTNFSDGLDFVLEVDADDIPAHDKDFFDRPYKDAAQAIKNLIAQEANKARLDELRQLQWSKDLDDTIKDTVYLGYIKDRLASLQTEGQL